MNLNYEMDDVISSDTHCGFVAIVGRPNVGKSTLLNKILGQKISITSRKPQTTRHRIVGIDTEGSYQTIYVDTPGLHKEEKRAINRLMNRAAESSIGNVELIFFVVDCSKWNQDDEMVLEKVKQSNIPTILVINKIDSVQNKNELLPVMEKLAGRMNFKDVIPVSAKQGTNVENLKKMARDVLPEGDLTVEIEEYKIQPNGTTKISGLILVEREGQKKMIIGAGGEKLKTIGTEARKDLENMLESKVFLQLWVKVKSGWADDERALRSLGYMDFMDN